MEDRAGGHGLRLLGGRQAAERSPVPIAATVGPAHALTYANAALRTSLGRPAEALRGEPISRLLGDDPVVAELLARVEREGVVEMTRVAWTRPDGQAFDATLVAWRDPDHEPHDAALVVQLVEARPVVTDRAREARHLQDSRELRAANEKLTVVALENATLLQREREAREEAARAVEALQDDNRRKDEFLAMLGHELRNPLAPIVNAVHVLTVRTREQPALTRLLTVIDRQVEHMTRLIDDLLEVSRIKSGKVRLERELLDLQDVVARGVETARPVIDGRRHQLRVAFPQGPTRVLGDRVRLAQVLANLLNNAAKYTEEGGEIWLSVHREGDRAVIRVRDTGVGIPQDMLAKIFDMFTQVARSADRSQGGLGLGLTVVRTVVEMHGGTIEALSGGLGTGSELVVRLPLVHDAPELLEGGAVEEPHRSRRVLVVDDNLDAAETLRAALEEDGHEVGTAHDGLAALEAVRAFHPDVVLLDLGLPKLDGLEVARRLRADPDARQLRLVALTGYGQDEDRRRTAAAGFDVHLVKPVNLSTLEDLLR